MLEFLQSIQLFPKRAFGLDISDRSVEALELRRGIGRQSISTYGRVELERGIIDDGHVLNQRALTSALRNLMSSAQPHAIKTKNVIISVPDAKTFTHIFQLPSVISGENIGESVQYEAEATIPLSFNQVYHDYHVLGKRDDQQDVLYVACFKDIVEDYRTAAAAAGLNVVAIEPESIALSRSLIGSIVRDPTLVVDIGTRVTNIAIHDRNGIRYSASDTTAGSSFIDAIASSLKVSRDKAAELRHSKGFTKKNQDVYDALEPSLNKLTEAINNATGFYKKQYGVPVSVIILSGGGSLTPGIAEAIKEKVGISVEIGNPLENVHYRKKLARKIKQPVLFATVVGLALRGISTHPEQSTINLLEHEDEKKKVIASEVIPVTPVDKKSPGTPFSERFKRLLANKRLLVLIVSFAVLIILFIVVLLLSNGGQEPLIQLQQSEFPTQ